MTTSLPKTLLQVGYVSRAHGLKGEVVVKTFDPTSTALEEVERVSLTLRSGESKIFEIATLGEAPGSDLLVSFTGVRHRDQADALKGATVHVFRDELEQPEEGEFFFGDLVGLEARTPAGQRLGVVEEVWSTGPVPNLCIRDGKIEHLVPFADDFVKKIDVQGGVIVVEPLVFEEA